MKTNTGLTLRQAYEQNNTLLNELSKILPLTLEQLNDNLGRLEDIPDSELDDNDLHDLQDELDLINRLTGYTQALADFDIITSQQLGNAWAIALDIRNPKGE